MVFFSFCFFVVFGGFFFFVSCERRGGRCVEVVMCLVIVCGFNGEFLVFLMFKWDRFVLGFIFVRVVVGFCR